MLMIRSIQTTAAAAALAFLVAAPPAFAQPAPERDPKAMEALSAMGKYLRSLKAFTLRGDTAIDEVLDNGQKIQFGGTVDYRVQQPDRLRLDVRNERRWRDFYYDGRNLTQYGPRAKYYAVVGAPATIAELVQAADQKYDIEIPLADLFLWGTDKSGLDDIKSASFIGPAQIGGKDCDHFAFRQEGVDWQIWIQQGKQPLPCKMVITTLSEPSQPQYSAVLSWNVAPKFDKSTFTFVPPKDAKQIPAAQVQPAAKK